MTNSYDANAPMAQCVLDRKLVNADTLPMMKDVGLSIFASACSKNRGAFVLHPPNGHTYGCLELPKNVLELAGALDGGAKEDGDDDDHDGEMNRRELRKERSDEIQVDEDSRDMDTDTDLNTTSTSHPFTVSKAEDIMTHYKDGNLTSLQAVNLLDFMVDQIYQSSANVQVEPYACDVNGLATLQCTENPPLKKSPIRAVTMAGVFTSAPWATGKQSLTLEEAASFYTEKDFKEMKKLGLNTVQIPVPIQMFSENSKNAAEWQDLLSSMLHQIRDHGLKVILLLDQGDAPSEDVAGPVQEAASFAQGYNRKHDVITAMTLPALDQALLEAAKTVAPDLRVWVPTKGGDFKILHEFHQADGVSLEFSHTATVGDIASSTSQEDRSKLFYHETMACIARAPLEYSACYQEMPVFVSSGFDLAIDDCHLKEISSVFRDYGQCDRFNETAASPWWKDHRYSFAARQLFAYEQGHGWSFASWKLWNSHESTEEIEEPAQLLALKDVVRAGLMPSLSDMDEELTYPLSNASSPVGLACLNPPLNDFVLGDATLAPTPAPPPDCGNGWWNFTTSKCDYWIPPTPAPCPVCSNDTVVVREPVECPELVPSEISVAEPPVQTGLIVKSFLSGAALSMVLCAVFFKVANRRRNGYDQVGDGSSQVSNGNGHYQSA